jgi:hypothetical protein
MKQLKVGIIYAVFMMLMVGCSKDVSKPNDENEHEAINKIELVFAETSGATTSFIMEDPDGDGGNPPSRIDTIKLNNNKQYTVTVKIYNISSGVVKDVSATVLMQATSHEFYFIPSGVSVTVQKTDKDKSGYPIGFLSSWQTAGAGTGSILFKLMHKTALKGPNDGPNVGHSDIQLNLPIIIK